jgi:hypothetical protein
MSTQDEWRSFMKKLRFIDNGLAGDVYYDERRQPSCAGLFLYGFPSFVGPNEVTRTLTSAGILSVQPHYFGTYDSRGLYSPSSLIETCTTVQQLFDRGYVSQAKDGNPYHLPNLKICVAHSFGCLTAVRGISALTTVELLILLAPAVHYRRSAPDFGLNEDGPAHLEYVRRSHPFTYRLSDAHDWENLLTGNDPLPTSVTHPALKQVVAAVGENDKYFDKDALRTSLPMIIKAYCGDKVDVGFHVVKGATHPIDSILSAFPLTRYLAGYA